MLFYRRTNIAVLCAVIVCTAVLTGALTIGDSVNYSLKLMLDNRLGKIQTALDWKDRFFPEDLAKSLTEKLDAPTAAVLKLDGLISNSDDSLRANRIQVVGVAESFFRLSPKGNPLNISSDSIILNEQLAGKISVKAGDEVVIRISKPGLMPREIPLTPVTELSISSRLIVSNIADANEFGLFNLQANQIPPLNAFVPLKWLQEQLNLPSQANVILIGQSSKGAISAQKANKEIQNCWQLQDAQLQVRHLDNKITEIRSSRVFIDEAISNAAMKVDKNTIGILTYFVNELRHSDKMTPYSMVTAISPSSNSVIPAGMPDDEILINQWLADDLGAKEGDNIQLTYFVVTSARKLEEKTSTFRIRDILPMQWPALDANLMPDFPGLSDAENCRDWKPGIDIDLDKIRPKDEEYWNNYKGTPKAFITLAAGQKLWGNRYGSLTAIRFQSDTDGDKIIAQLMNKIEPSSIGLYFQPVRSSGTKASEQSTDFGQLFIGFNFFIIASALVLMGLLFIFGIEKRTSEAGTLLAVGILPKTVTRCFLIEGLLIALLGAIAGVFAGLIYTRAMIFGLSTLWQTAVVGSKISFHAETITLLISAVSGIVISGAAMWFTLLKKLRRQPRELLDENIEWEYFTSRKISEGRFGLFLALISLCGALLLIFAESTGTINESIAFFSAGILLLTSSIAFIDYILKAAAIKLKKTVKTISGLGFRNTTRRSSRSLAVITMLSCGIFIIFAVGANRHNPLENSHQRASGTGGFALFGESSIGILFDLNSASARKSLGIEAGDLNDVKFVQLRLLEGDDASCMNLNRAQQPQLLGVDPQQFKARNAFLFTRTIKTVENGWDLLNQNFGEDIVAAVGDEATVRWALGKSIGDELIYLDEKGNTFRLKITGMIKNSILQGSLLISEENFIKHFPSQSGYRTFLVDAPDQTKAKAAQILSGRLRDFGTEFSSAGERLAAFSAVEETYLSIFQLLGSLGLVLGSIGLGLVVMRNVLDRRGELAMMRAVGFNKSELKAMLLYEHSGLLAAGLIIGIITAIIAVSPILRTPEAKVPYIELLFTAVIIAASGFLWIWTAASAALKGNLLEALRNE